MRIRQSKTDTDKMNDISLATSKISNSIGRIEALKKLYRKDELIINSFDIVINQLNDAVEILSFLEIEEFIVKHKQNNNSDSLRQTPTE